MPNFIKNKKRFVFLWTNGWTYVRTYLKRTDYGHLRPALLGPNKHSQVLQPKEKITSILQTGNSASYWQFCCDNVENLLNAAPTETSTKHGSNSNVCSVEKSVHLFILAFGLPWADWWVSSQKRHSSDAGNNFATVSAKFSTRQTMLIDPEHWCSLTLTLFALVSERLTLIIAEEKRSEWATCVTFSSNVIWKHTTAWSISNKWSATKHTRTG